LQKVGHHTFFETQCINTDTSSRKIGLTGTDLPLLFVTYRLHASCMHQLSSPTLTFHSYDSQ